MSIIRAAAGVVDQLESSKTVKRSTDELVIRRAVEEWGRPLWPEARLVHELVVGRGLCRADMAFIDETNLVAIEIKSGYDNTDRLMMQAAHFSLAGPEVWLVIDTRHIADAHMIRYLMPWLGLIEAKVAFPTEYSLRNDIEKWSCKLRVVDHAKPRVPLPKAWLNLLWRDELFVEAQRHRLSPGVRAKHGWLVDEMAAKMSVTEQRAAVCRQLRQRNAFWRADPPMFEPKKKTPAAEAGAVVEVCNHAPSMG